MNLFEALFLGIIQGLTEFLPVSSSGHLELGKHLFGIDPETNFYFSVAVHGATLLSTLIVFRHDIIRLFKGLKTPGANAEKLYFCKIIMSMIPVGIAGLFMFKLISIFYNGNLILLSAAFLVTALLLTLTVFIKPKERSVTFRDAFVIGLAQALAVLPGISRSGATIATGMMLGNRKEELPKFSFLMVIIPIAGANFIELFSGNFTTEGTYITGIITGFLAAFISGYLACRWMVDLVKKGKLVWFAVYVTLVGLFTLLLGLHVI